jgi:hypothetical protein
MVVEHIQLNAPRSPQEKPAIRFASAIERDFPIRSAVLARILHEGAVFELVRAWMHLQIPERSVGIWSLQFMWALWVPHIL